MASARANSTELRERSQAARRAGVSAPKPPSNTDDVRRVAQYFGINIPTPQEPVRSTTPAIASAYTNAAGQQVQAGSGRSGGGGGGGGAAPAPAASAPVAPRAYSAPAPSANPYNMIAAQGMFRADRANLQNTLQETLAQILFDKQRQYRGLDTSRETLGRQEIKGARETGEDFAARGLGSSGLYKQALDEMLSGFQRGRGELDTMQQNLAQQYGARGALKDINPSRLYGDDYTALANVYGLLGQRGTSAGQQYGSALNQARAQAAARAGQSIFGQAGF
jgi:hypothetical protein